MAKNNAERQAAYRARHLKSEHPDVERLNIMIGFYAKRRLERVSNCYGVTQRAMLERLLLQAEQEALDEAGEQRTGHADYFAGRLRLGDTIIKPLQLQPAPDNQNSEG